MLQISGIIVIINKINPCKFAFEKGGNISLQEFYVKLFFKYIYINHKFVIMKFINDDF